MRLIFAILLLAVAGLTSAGAASFGPELPAERLYRQAVNQSARASELESRGKIAEAIEGYELAGQVCEASLNELDLSGVPLEERSPDVYYRAATSFLHAGRLLTQLRREGRQKEEDLAKAVRYLELVDQIEMTRAQRARTAVNPELWRVRNAAAYASFLRGELAQARLHYEEVLQMNPTYTPAERAVAEISRLERRQNEVFSPQGRTLNKEKTRKAIREIIDTLKLVKDVVSLGR